MNKVKKLFIAIQRLVKSPALLNLIIDDPEQSKKEVVSKYGLSSGFNELNFFELTANHPLKLPLFSFGGGGSMPTDLLLLCAMANKIKECNYFEIGTWRGESAYNVSHFAAKVFTLNLGSEELKRLNQPQQYIDQIGYFSNKRNNIEHLRGNSFSFDFRPYHQKMDLVFVDGDHRYPAVVNDTKKAFDLIKDKNCCIVWHDYAATPDELRYEVMLGILDGAPEWARKHLYKVSNSLCAIYYPFTTDTKRFEYPGEISETVQIELLLQNQ